MTSVEDFHQLAAQEAALAQVAVTNESRAQHYAMAAYYTRLAEAKEKLPRTPEVMAVTASDETSNTATICATRSRGTAS